MSQNARFGSETFGIANFGLATAIRRNGLMFATTLFALALSRRRVIGLIKVN
jgi:hypothetical protein